MPHDAIKEMEIDDSPNESGTNIVTNSTSLTASTRPVGVTGYVKKFDEWNTLKKTVHERQIPQPSREKIKAEQKHDGIYCKPRDIWYAHVGVNIGSETDGKHANHERPVLILKTFSTNMFFAIPLTSKNKGKGSWYFPITCSDGTVSGNAILAQARVMDSRRLIRKMDKRMDEQSFEILKHRFSTLLTGLPRANHANGAT